VIGSVSVAPEAGDGQRRSRTDRVVEEHENVMTFDGALETPLASTAMTRAE
jgi:hypothetical protein